MTWLLMTAMTFPLAFWMARACLAGVIWMMRPRPVADER